MQLTLRHMRFRSMLRHGPADAACDATHPERSSGAGTRAAVVADEIPQLRPGQSVDAGRCDRG